MLRVKTRFLVERWRSLPPTIKATRFSKTATGFYPLAELSNRPADDLLSLHPFCRREGANKQGSLAFRHSGRQLLICYGFRGSSRTWGLVTSALGLDVGASMHHTGIIMIVNFLGRIIAHINKFKTTCCCALGCHNWAGDAWNMPV